VFAVACRARRCITTVAIRSNRLTIRRACPLRDARQSKHNNGNRHPHGANQPLRPPCMPRIYGCSGSFGAWCCWQNSPPYDRLLSLNAGASWQPPPLWRFSVSFCFIAALPANRRRRIPCQIFLQICRFPCGSSFGWSTSPPFVMMKVGKANSLSNSLFTSS
jgi:hypothetical protein